MKNPTSSILVRALLAAALISCKGAAVDSKVIPTSSTLSLDIPQGSGQALGGGDFCHPHLFERTFLAVAFFNGLTGLVFAGIADVIDTTKPTCTAGDCTWTLAGSDGFTYTVEVKPSGKSYDCTVSVAPRSGGSAVQVVTGSVTPTDGQAHTGQGTMTFDFTQLATVNPLVKTAGQMTVNFDVTGANKTLDFTLTNFTPDSASAWFPAHDGQYVFARTEGVGGSFKFQESVDLWCPINVANSQATLQTVAQWSSQSGTFYGRADSLMTGGQIPSGQSWVGLTCANLSESSALSADELYWLMKNEDSNGNSLAPSPYCIDLTTDGGSGGLGAGCATVTPGTDTCLSVFGALPNPANSSSDFNFSAVNFDDGSVVPYPGQTSSADGG